jgi:hypothetical protein
MNTPDPVKPTHWGNTEFGQCIGVACIILAFLLGIGGCCAMGGGFAIKLKDPQEETAK